MPAINACMDWIHLSTSWKNHGYTSNNDSNTSLSVSSPGGSSRSSVTAWDLCQLSSKQQEYPWAQHCLCLLENILCLSTTLYKTTHWQIMSNNMMATKNLQGLEISIETSKQQVTSKCKRQPKFKSWESRERAKGGGWQLLPLQKKPWPSSQRSTRLLPP